MKRFVVILGVLLAAGTGVFLWQRPPRLETRLADARDKVGTRAASPLLDRLAEDYPAEPEVALLQARQARLAGRPQQVVTELERAKRLNAPTARVDRERLLTLAAVDPAAARDPLERLAAAHPDDPDVQLAVAALALEAGREARTLDLVDRILAAGADPFARHLRGKCLLRTRHLPEARADLEAAAAAGPDHLVYPAARVDLATCLLEQGEFVRAHELFLAARADDPASLLAAFGVGRTAGYLDRLPEAEAAFRDVLQQQPAHVETLLAAAQVVEQRGDLPAAVAFLDRAVAAEPDRAETHARLAKLLAAVGDEKRAAAHESRYREIEAARLKSRPKDSETRP